MEFSPIQVHGLRSLVFFSPPPGASTAAAEWPDPKRAVAIRSQSDGCACVHETGWLWPLRMAKRAHEWATSGAERRNLAAYGHAIIFAGCFRTVLGVGVDEAGSVSFFLSATSGLY